MIPVRLERARGCGFRKVGGLYVVAAALGPECGRLPALVTSCGSCGRGIKPARGWTWVNPEDVMGGGQRCLRQACTSGCPLNPMGELMRQDRAGLLWIGEAFYSTAAAFTQEAAKMGVSRRIARVPHGLVPNETWVMLGHRKAIKSPCSSCCEIQPGLFGPTIPPPSPECRVCRGTGWEWKPGIVAVFKSEAVEYVCSGDESADDLDRLRARALTPVRVLHDHTDGTGAPQIVAESA